MARSFQRRILQRMVDRTALWVIVAIATGCLVLGCSAQNGNLSGPPLVQNATTNQLGEPSHITVQHVLIAFNGSIRGKAIGRSRDEAAQLAEEVLQRAQAGEDFDALVREFTDDSTPGIYHLANSGQPSDTSPPKAEDKVFPREGMAPAFGNISFKLEAGEIGMAAYDPLTSPFGWHIIKRLR